VRPSAVLLISKEDSLDWEYHTSDNDADDREVSDRVIVSKPYRDVPPESPLRSVDPRV